MFLTTGAIKVGRDAGDLVQQVRVQVQVGPAEGLRGFWPYETRFLSTSVFSTSFAHPFRVPHLFAMAIRKLFSQYTYTDCPEV